MGGRCAEAPPCALRHAQREIDADKETGRADLALEGGEGVTGAESDLEDVFALSGIEQPPPGQGAVVWSCRARVPAQLAMQFGECSHRRVRTRTRAPLRDVRRQP